LPEPALVTEIQFDVPVGRGGGGGARGAAAGATPPTVPFPRAFKIETSVDGRKWGRAVAEGRGAPGRNTVVFAPVRAKFIRITQTDEKPDAPDWSMTNVRIFQAQSSTAR
jgi:hypothetical protein